MAELLFQVRLQGMVARTANGAPSIHGDSLVVQELAGIVIQQALRAVEEVLSGRGAAAWRRVVPEPAVQIDVCQPDDLIPDHLDTGVVLQVEKRLQQSIRRIRSVGDNTPSQILIL